MTERSVSHLPISESEYQGRIIEYALTTGWRFVHFRPARTGAGWRTAMMGQPGWPDLVLLRGERLVVLEVKLDGRQPRPDQREWLDAWLRIPCAEVLVAMPSNWTVVERMLR